MIGNLEQLFAAVQQCFFANGTAPNSAQRKDLEKWLFAQFEGPTKHKHALQLITQQPQSIIQWFGLQLLDQTTRDKHYVLDKQEKDAIRKTLFDMLITRSVKNISMLTIFKVFGKYDQEQVAAFLGVDGQVWVARNISNLFWKHFSNMCRMKIGIQFYY